MIVTRFIYKNMFYKVCMYVANKQIQEGKYTDVHFK